MDYAFEQFRAALSHSLGMDLPNPLLPEILFTIDRKSVV